MRMTSAREVKTAINNGDITDGMTYTTTAGMFYITDLDGNGDIIGHAAEIEVDEDGNAEVIGNPTHITAADLIGAEF